jgi:hypothetical protein
LAQDLQNYFRTDTHLAVMGYTTRLLWFISQLPPCIFEVGPIYTYGELFSGEMAWSRGMMMLEYRGVSFDKKYSVMAEDYLHTDFVTPFGFLRVIVHIMQMHQWGVFLAAIPCCSWVWMSRCSTGRHVSILGYESSAFIQAQNAIVSRIVYLLILCIKRGVYWLVEQPWTSTVWSHPRWLYLTRKYGDQIKWVETDMGIFTLDLVKKTIIVGTAPYIHKLGKILSPEARKFVIDNPEKKHTSTPYIDSSGKPRTNGGPDLKGTEEYPMGFGARHALLYQEACGHFATEPKPGMPLEACDSDSEIGEEDEACLRDFRDGFHTFEYNTGSSSSSRRKRKSPIAEL